MAKVLAALGMANLWTLFLFWHDKRRAIAGGRRVPEATLLWWAALGGWVGALAGRRWFRHKTRKQPFATLLLLIAGGETGALLGWLYLGAPLPAGAERLLLAL
jgi:uncharacterized membrane protein YsdA (DUF1294 family)